MKAPKMNPLKKIIATAVVLFGLLSFNTKENQPLPSNLNLEEINIFEMLNAQQFECRPSSEFMFYVEMSLVKKVRGASQINAKVYLSDKVSGKRKLLANENIQISKFEGIFFNQENHFEKEISPVYFKNGDILIGEDSKTAHYFKKLMQFDVVYAAYIRATNQLLELKRTI